MTLSVGSDAMTVWKCPLCDTVDGEAGAAEMPLCVGPTAEPHEPTVLVETRYVTLAAVVGRIQHCADVIAADDVSRTSRTLNRMALVLEAEYGGKD